MKEIVERLLENHRIDEASRKVAIDSILDLLRERLKKVNNYSHHALSIEPNYREGRIDITFEGTDDSFAVYPKLVEVIPDVKSTKPMKVSNIDGAYVKDNTVYDKDGNKLGDAYVRVATTYNKSDYSIALEDAEYRFNSKIVNLQRLEKYVAREAIDNMAEKR